MQPTGRKGPRVFSEDGGCNNALTPRGMADGRESGERKLGNAQAGGSGDEKAIRTEDSAITNPFSDEREMESYSGRDDSMDIVAPRIFKVKDPLLPA